MLNPIIRFFSVPIFQDTDKQRVANLLHIILQVMMLLVVVLTAILTLVDAREFWGDLLNVGIVLGALFLMLWMRVLLRRGRLYLSSVLLSLLLWAGTTLTLFFYSGIRNSVTVVYLLSIIIAGLLLGGRGALAFTGLNVVTVVILYYVEVSQWVVYEAPSSLPQAFDVIVFGSLFGIGGLLLRYAADYLTHSLRLAIRNERAQIQANRELDKLRASLEQQVSQRTRDLERRTRYLEAASQVSRVVSSTLDEDVLAEQVVELLREQFDLFYVGLFLVTETVADAAGKWAALQMGTGEIGQMLRSQRYGLPVDADPVVGWCIAHNEVRLVRDEVLLAEKLATDALSQARSRAALPLRSRGRVSGALDIYSERPAALDSMALTVLQNIADQVAVALDNARLFSESRSALEAERRAYGQMSRDAWRQLLVAGMTPGYEYTGAQVRPITEAWRPETETGLQEKKRTVLGEPGTSTLALPIKTRGQTIGVVNLRKGDEHSTWSDDEVSLVETLTDQLSVALESARLYRATLQRAAQEQMVGEMTTHLRESLDMDEVLRAAVRELGGALPGASVQVRLGTVTTAE